MTKNNEIESIEAELSFIQNEIDRRHSRRDEGVDPQRNQEKIDELRVKKNHLRDRLQELKGG